MFLHLFLSWIFTDLGCGFGPCFLKVSEIHGNTENCRWAWASINLLRQASIQLLWSSWMLWLLTCSRLIDYMFEDDFDLMWISVFYNNDKKNNLCPSTVLHGDMFRIVCFNMFMFRLVQVMKIVLDISAANSCWEVVVQSLERQILLLFFPLVWWDHSISSSVLLGHLRTLAHFTKPAGLHREVFFRIYCLSQASLHFLLSPKYLLQLLENVCFQYSSRKMMLWSRWFLSMTVQAARLLTLEFSFNNRTKSIQVHAEEIIFKPWLTLGQTGGVTMASLFSQPDKTNGCWFPLSITDRKEEMNLKYKNVFFPLISLFF